MLPGNEDEKDRHAGRRSEGSNAQRSTQWGRGSVYRESNPDVRKMPRPFSKSLLQTCLHFWSLEKLFTRPRVEDASGGLWWDGSALTKTGSPPHHTSGRSGTESVRRSRF